MYKYNMVVLLSSGKINNRLLCELATHPNFLRLMVDMEIHSILSSISLMFIKRNIHIGIFEI